jgi:RNase P/RNase MRP subunit POP5
MKLRPSQRANRRYICIESQSKQEIEQEILKGIGTLGWAKADPVFVDSNGISKPSNCIILAVNRESLDNIRAAFALSAKPLKIKKVSGTLKAMKD